MGSYQGKFHKILKRAFFITKTLLVAFLRKMVQKYMNEGNVVASPLSIAGALHMLAAGAAGDTRYQICEKGLGLDPEIFGTRKGVSHKEPIFSQPAF